VPPRAHVPCSWPPKEGPNDSASSLPHCSVGRVTQPRRQPAGSVRKIPYAFFGAVMTKTQKRVRLTRHSCANLAEFSSFRHLFNHLLVSGSWRCKGPSSAAHLFAPLSPRICNCVPCVASWCHKGSLLNGTGRQPLHKAIYIVPRLGSPGTQVRGYGAMSAVARVRRDETRCGQNVVRDGWVGFHELAVGGVSTVSVDGTGLACPNAMCGGGDDHGGLVCFSFCC
jgi:hypothetical protein